MGLHFPPKPGAPRGSRGPGWEAPHAPPSAAAPSLPPQQQRHQEQLAVTFRAGTVPGRVCAPPLPSPAHPASRFRPLPWTLQMATLGLEPSLWPRLCSWVPSPRVMGFREDHQTLFLPILPTPSPWVASSVPRMDGAHAPASSHPAAWLRGSTCIRPSLPRLLLDVSQHPAQRAQTQLLTPLPSLSGTSTTLRMTSEAGEPCPSSSNPSHAPWLASAGFGQFCVLSISEVGSASTRLSAPAAPLHTSRDMGHMSSLCQTSLQLKSSCHGSLLWSHKPGQIPRWHLRVTRGQKPGRG